MTHLLDVNVLVSLAWPNHVHHAASRRWFADHHGAGWATCGVTESGFIRVSSNHRVTPDARTPGEAALLLHRMCALDGHTFLIDDVSLASAHELLGATTHASAHVTDAHLILLAQQAGATFVTFDRAAAGMATSLGVPRTLLAL